MRVPRPMLRLRRRGSLAPRDDLERNRLLRFGSPWGPRAELNDTPLSMRPSAPAHAPAAAEDVVGVGTDGEKSTGGSGRGALEGRRELLEKEPDLSRPAVAWLPVFGLDSFWDGLRGDSADWALPMVCGRRR